MKPILLGVLMLMLAGCASDPFLKTNTTNKLYPDQTGACFAPCVPLVHDTTNLVDYVPQSPYALPCLGWSNGTQLSHDRADLSKYEKPIYPAVLYVNEAGDWDAMWVRGKP